MPSKLTLPFYWLHFYIVSKATKTKTPKIFPYWREEKTFSTESDHGKLEEEKEKERKKSLSKEDFQIACLCYFGNFLRFIKCIYSYYYFCFFLFLCWLVCFLNLAGILYLMVILLIMPYCVKKFSLIFFVCVACHRVVISKWLS